MTGARRVRRTRLQLAFTLGAAALAWAAAAAGATLLGFAMLDLAWGLPRAVRTAAWPLALATAGVTSLVVLWRGRRVRSDEAVALWIEARRPALRFALVTAVDPRYAGRVPDVEAAVRAVSWGALLRRTALRAIGVPGALALAMVGLGSALPAGTMVRVTGPRAGDVLDRPVGGGVVDTALVIRVHEPAYAGGGRRVHENPTVVTALVGSRITVEGRGWAEVVVDEDRLEVQGGGDRWHTVAVMPERPALIRVRQGASERLVALEPVPDSVPEVVLAAPVRDTVLRVAEGTLRLSAVAFDDHGLREGRFDYIISSGSGESFRFRSGQAGQQVLTGSRDSVAAVLDLAALDLRPGDVVHLRAIALDGNDVTGPGEGVSETRSIRIARPDEYDTSAVIVLPPIGADTSLLSQRILINLTEALVERVPDLRRDALVAESERLARDQAALRRRVADVIFMRLGADVEGEHAHGGDEEGGEGGDDLTPAGLLEAAEAAVDEGVGEALDFHGDETPVLAINRPLLEAYNAMWDAGRELGVADPAAALPHMYDALEAIQRARTAERIYLRGRPPTVVVDLARVRLAGDTDEAAPAERPGLPPDPRVALARRFDRFFRSPRDGLADSLLVLRLEALTLDPALASALGAAAAAVRSGADATEFLVRARRQLGPPIARTEGLPVWSGGWNP